MAANTWAGLALPGVDRVMSRLPSWPREVLLTVVWVLPVASTFSILLMDDYLNVLMGLFSYAL
ncbi:hypothetical protein D3C78_1851370 [compost metagenome]